MHSTVDEKLSPKLSSLQLYSHHIGCSSSSYIFLLPPFVQPFLSFVIIPMLCYLWVSFFVKLSWATCSLHVVGAFWCVKYMLIRFVCKGFLFYSLVFTLPVWVYTLDLNSIVSSSKSFNWKIKQICSLEFFMFQCYQCLYPLCCHWWLSDNLGRSWNFCLESIIYCILSFQATLLSPIVDVRYEQIVISKKEYS